MHKIIYFYFTIINDNESLKWLNITSAISSNIEQSRKKYIKILPVVDSRRVELLTPSHLFLHFEKLF